MLSIIAASNSSGSGGSFVSIGILLLIPLAMYFLLIRPQRRRQRAQQEMQSGLDVGDEVMTASGIYGFITGFEDDKVWIEIDDDVQIRVNRGFLQGKVDTSGVTPPAKGGTTSTARSGSGALPAPRATPTVKGRKGGATSNGSGAETADSGAAESSAGE